MKTTPQNSVRSAATANAPDGPTRSRGSIGTNEPTSEPDSTALDSEEEETSTARGADLESANSNRTNDTGSNQWVANPSYTIYKANQRGNGAALQISINRAKAAVFVEGALQTGPKQFGWDEKVIMKWTLSDLGNVLAVLQGRTPSCKLFHQSERANSAFELAVRDDEDPAKAPYFLSLSRQDGETKAVRRIGLTVAHGEAAILETALRTAIARLINW